MLNEIASKDLNINLMKTQPLSSQKYNFAAIHNVQTPSVVDGTQQSHQGLTTETSPRLEDHLSKIQIQKPI